MCDEFDCTHFSRYLSGIEELYALLYFVCRESIVDVRDLYDIMEIVPAKFSEADALRTWLTLREMLYPVKYFHMGSNLHGKLYETLTSMPEKYQKRTCDILTDYFRDKNPRSQFKQIQIEEMVEILCEYTVCIRDFLCIERFLPHELIKIYSEFSKLDISTAGFDFHQTKKMLKFAAQKKCSKLYTQL